MDPFLPGLNMEPEKTEEEKQREMDINLRFTALRAAENYYYRKGTGVPTTNSYRDIIYAAEAIEKYLRDGGGM